MPSLIAVAGSTVASKPDAISLGDDYFDTEKG